VPRDYDVEAVGYYYYSKPIGVDQEVIEVVSPRMPSLIAVMK